MNRCPRSILCTFKSDDDLFTKDGVVLFYKRRLSVGSMNNNKLDNYVMVRSLRWIH